ncbi:hypothetical protein [Candidatus Uabimicrobium sp. HlEnr_7]|uniref:hypothetical protein n=1 Tax=Candidatus Uabimicrobium helgolandensis TaxID=3095367 RepID=UPI00355674C1
MKSDYHKILTENCNFLQAKCFFFSITEEWITPSSSEEQIFVKQVFENTKNKYPNKYYRAIFHLLSCPFCLERSSVLRERSHPQLWKLSQKNTSLQFAKTVQLAKHVTRQQDEALYYLALLHRQLSEKKPFVIQRNRLPAAAGNSEELVSIPQELLKTMALPSDMEIICEHREKGYEVRIQCSVPIKLKMIFCKNKQQLFQLDISQRIPKELIPSEIIKDWDEIQLLRVK